jgi:phosphatidylserine/phosphatidylglycerophosphate/cardiolipin synthase-like enzyme
VASLNFTRKCFRTTWDALVITHDPEVVAGLRRLMAADREGQPAPPDLTPRLIVGPERARRQLTALIERAQASIRLVDAKVSDPDLLALLKDKRSAGVAVDVYGARKIGGLKSHGKIMMIDDATVVVGSLALAALSLDFRREVAIVLDSPAALAETRQFFAMIDAAQRDQTASAADAGSSTLYDSPS